VPPRGSGISVTRKPRGRIEKENRNGSEAPAFDQQMLDSIPIGWANPGVLGLHRRQRFQRTLGMRISDPLGPPAPVDVTDRDGSG